ncbi:MAG TPA: BTAD domain-containing putative transcriptional regulator [Gemmatimonadaceae bacterium]|nr:BTAD domain-containing putative transcriptional regulator [Gemmatimonadaceae bacterium]
MERPLFSLRLFGGAVLANNDGSIAGRAVQRRRLALLALLAAAPNFTRSRDKLVGLLWPDADMEQARHLLSDSLYILHRALGKDALTAVGGDIVLDTRIVSVDVAEFRAALAASNDELAVSLYRGPFLDGVFLRDAPEFERWMEAERSELARDYTTALERLAITAQQAGDFRKAVCWWRRRAAHDPYNSHVAVALMNALAAAGDRAGAIQHGHLHATLVREELGLEPDAQVRALADRVRSEAAAAPAALVPSLRKTITPTAEPAAEKPFVQPRSSRTSVPARVAVSAAVILVFGGMISVIRDNPATAAAERPQSVVLAAIGGPDSTLSLAVREAVRAELESAPGIRVVPDYAARQTLRLMTLPPTTSITLPVALELAQRRGATLVVTGSAARVGTGVQLIAQLVDASSGSVLATLTQRPAGDDDVLAAVTRMAQSLRARVLEAPVDTVASLPAVSTASLDALRHYVRARQALANSDAAGAAELAEAALVHDSLFALAHYLAADQLWYIDRQRHSDEHMTRAYELSSRLPPRERLIVRARYEQLVRDRPDSALAYWKLLARSYPDEALAYEGMRWVYRALGQIDSMVAAAENAYLRDPALREAYVQDKTIALLVRGDSAAGFDFAARAGSLKLARTTWAIEREDWLTALALFSPTAHGLRHFVLLAMGRVAEARHELTQVRVQRRAQDPPRALLLQARVEVGVPPLRAKARLLIHEALRWVEAADLSPPAYARLAERIADAAARDGDIATIQRVRRFIHSQDNGRQLRSYRMALASIAAAEAFARGDMVAAADLAAQARPGIFYGRSVGTVMMLEADARAAAGERAAADSLYREIVAGNFADWDHETLAILRRFARAALARPS